MNIPSIMEGCSELNSCYCSCTIENVICRQCGQVIVNLQACSNEAVVKLKVVVLALHLVKTVQLIAQDQPFLSDRHHLSSD